MTWEPHSAVTAGNEAEDRIATWLAQRGYAWQHFGARVFDPRTPPVAGVQAIQTAVHASSSALRYAPDGLVARDGGPVLVEVIAPTSQRADGTRCMSLPKLIALDMWAAIAPVVVIDATSGTAWRHHPQTWVGDVLEPSPGHNPYVIQQRRGEHPMGELFTERA